MLTVVVSGYTSTVFFFFFFACLGKKKYFLKNEQNISHCWKLLYYKVTFWRAVPSLHLTIINSIHSSIFTALVPFARIAIPWLRQGVSHRSVPGKPF